jgi:nucleotidyltransferase-like protein
MVDTAVVKSVQHYLAEVKRQGIPGSYGVIFGSQARGDVHQWSDIDLLVVSPKFDQQRSRTDVDTLWIIAANTDNRIEPIGVGERQYIEDTSSAIVEIARREGQIVHIDD